jgi:hypothetical protein
LLHAISITRMGIRTVLPIIRTFAILLHVLPYQRWHLDGVDLTSGHMQLSSHIFV